MEPRLAVALMVDRSKKLVLSSFGMWLGWALLIGPFVVAIVLEVIDARLREPPSGDWALLEARVLGATRGEGIGGAYSRYGPRHPGPLPFYAWAPFYLLGGKSTAAVHVAAGLWNAFWLGTAAKLLGSGSPGERWLARAVLGLGVSVLSTSWMRGSILTEIWNPFVGAMAMLALFVAAVQIARGRLGALPWAVGAHAYAAQAHLQYLLPATALLLGGGVLYGARRRRRQVAWGSFGSRWVWLAAVVAGVLWAPSIFDALRSDESNEGRWVDVVASLSSKEANYPWHQALRFLGQPFANGLRELGMPPLAAVWFGVGVNVAALVWGVRVRAQTRVLALFGVAVLSAGLYGAFLPGVRHSSYLFFGLMPLGCMVWMGVLPNMVPEPHRVLVAATILLVAACIGTMPLLERAIRDRPRAGPAAVLDAALEAIGSCGAGHDVRLRFQGPDAWRAGAGLGLALEKRGWRVVTSPDEAGRFGPPFESAPIRLQEGRIWAVIERQRTNDVSWHGYDVRVSCP